MARHPAYRLAGKLGPFVVLAFLVSLASQIFRSLLVVFDRDKPFLPEEKPELRWLFDWPGLWDVGFYSGGAVLIVLMGVLLLKRLRAEERISDDRFAIGSYLLAILGQAIAFIHPVGSVITGVGCYASFLVVESVRLREGPAADSLAVAGHALEGFSLRTLWDAGTEIFLLPAVAFLIAAIAEVLWFASCVVDVHVTAVEVLTFEAMAFSACFISGARMALEFFCVLLLAREFSRPRTVAEGRSRAGWRLAIALVCFWMAGSLAGAWYEMLCLTALVYLARLWGREARHESQRLLFLATVTGIYFWARFRDFVYSVLGDAIEKHGLEWVARALIALLAILLAAWTFFGLRAICRRHAPQRTMDLLVALVLSVVFPFTALLVRWLGRGTNSAAQLLRRLAAVVVPVICPYLWGLIELLYPEYNDYTEVVHAVYSVLIVILMFQALFLLYACFSRGRGEHRAGARVAVLGLLAASFGMYATIPQDQTLCLIKNQYTKIIHGIIDLSRLHPRETEIDFRTPPDPGIEGLRRQGRYPDAPQLAFYRDRRPPIFFMIWDAARPDHMSLYGYGRRTTPRAEELAAQAVVFERAYANSTATTCSMRHLFTGKYESRYMMDQDHDPYFTGELVRDLGYERVLLNLHGSDLTGIGAAAFLRKQSERERIERATVVYRDYDEELLMKRTVELLDRYLEEREGCEHPADGLFAYLHSNATHYPWELWTDHQIYGEEIVDRYDNSIGHTDHWMGWFLDQLRERGIYDDAVIILTADHGTGLGDHLKYGGFRAYEEQIHVPLIIKAPGFAPRRVSSPVTGIDLAPTILSLFRGGQENPHTGFSLVDLMAGRAERLDRRYIISLFAFEDALALQDVHLGMKLQYYRGAGYKLLFDLNADPEERLNLADERVDLVREYMRFLHRFLWEGRDSYANPDYYRDRMK